MAGEPENEQVLIRQARQGSLDAFNELVLAYQDRVYSAAYRIMGEPASAADAAQDTFITAYRRLSTYRGGSFRAWLLRIATNTCYDELRRRKRRPQSSLDELTEDNESFSFLSSSDIGPEGQSQQLEMMRAIEHCLAGLPDDQRVTTVLCDVEGYDYQEIADITRVSLGTVKSRMSRARAKLRDCLQGFAELLPVSYRLGT